MPEGHRRRLERPAVALRRQQRLLGGRVLPPDGRQRRRRRPRHQQGHGAGEAQAFAAAAGIPVLASIPADEDIRRKSANYEIIGLPGGRWAPLFEGLASAAAAAPPVRPAPLSQEDLLGLFKGEAVGRGVVLDPATLDDMCGSALLEKPSLEVVYEAA